MSKLFFMSLLCLSSAALAGHERGDSGDPFFNDIVEAKALAKQVLSATQPDWLLRENEDATRLLQPEQRAQMVTELESAPLVPRAENPNGLCGQTERQRGASIFFSKAACPQATTESERTFVQWQLARALIVEIAHHFDLDAHEAAEFAVAVVEAYEQGAPILGLWYLTDETWINLVLDEEGELIVKSNITLVHHWSNLGRQTFVHQFDTESEWLRQEGKFSAYALHPVLDSRPDCPSVGYIKGIGDGHSLEVTYWASRVTRVNDDTCIKTGFRKVATWTASRRKFDPFKDTFTWRWILEGKVPAYRKPQGETWNFIYNDAN